MDFDSEQAAELAVKALKAEGQQAQMARVSFLLRVIALNHLLCETINGDDE